MTAPTSRLCSDAFGGIAPAIRTSPRRNDHAASRRSLRQAALCAGLALALSGLHWPLAHAQSDAISRPSELSVAASVEVPAAALSALAQGGEFVIGAIAVSGGVAAITVSAVGVGGSFVIYVSAEALKAGAVAVGKALKAVAVSGGWLLYASGEALCFVADEATRRHLHSHEIGP